MAEDSGRLKTLVQSELESDEKDDLPLHLDPRRYEPLVSDDGRTMGRRVKPIRQQE